MTAAASFLAADLGASSGRVMVGRWNGRLFSLEELHRFPNAGVRAGDRLYWDALGMWSHIQEGIAKYGARFEDPPQSIGIDSWGGDFGLLDRRGRLLGNPVHYRDSRTEGMPAKLFERIDEEEFFRETGTQTSRLNTLFQLYSMVRDGDPQLQCAETFLMIPDLFLYYLSGEKGAEYSEATTTQMYSLVQNDWARDFLTPLQIPLNILPAVSLPGSLRGHVRAEIIRDCRLKASFPVIAVASHDTASAVAAIPGMDWESLFISSGTWSLIGVEASQPNTSAEAKRLGFTNEGGANGSILFLRNLAGLWILQECIRQWDREGRRYDWAELLSAAEAAQPFKALLDPDVGDFLAPAEMPRAIHEYCRATGQTPPESAGEIARCIFESLSLKYRSVLDSLEQLTARRLKTIRIVGGGSLNPLLCQMVADNCGRPVVAGPAEASALGNVMLQAVATGHLPDVDAGRGAVAASVRLATYSPRPNDAWDEAFARFRSLGAASKNRAGENL